MELIFIRHGQGEHTLDLPASLQLMDPGLTKDGVSQAKSLQTQFTLAESDIVIVSPIRRTLQTAYIWSNDINCKKIVSPLVSPRMFPQNPKWKTLPCDRILNKKVIKGAYPTFTIDEGLPEELWSSGINTMPEQEFNVLAESFLEWCRSQSVERIYVVSHDGTITSYRQFISGKRLTRKDFPKETGWFKQLC
ncbi:histidine phosphatase family protein [Mesobacillus zeae]|uniref:Histidine phosphatase family protein n=1 Tax=Mesobacillus zeae TaxID=1917180 RepID=A0A398B3D8_9BACI|nr:histidine phosphatase family protein [Mesobacillus zeae]RID82306.1 histidine phosphatase family protein [Mesobacillus zeae]